MTGSDGQQEREAWTTLTELVPGYGLMLDLWVMTQDSEHGGGDERVMLRSAVASLRRAKWHAESTFEHVAGEKRWRRADGQVWAYEVRS